MTALEAFQTVEDAVSALKLKDSSGEILEGIEAVGAFASFHGERWDQVTDDFECRRITPAQYTEQMLKLVKELDGYLSRRRVERKLANLMRQSA